MFSKLCLIFSVLISISNIVVGFDSDLNDLLELNIQKESETTKNDFDCDTQLGYFTEAFSAREVWALELFDTWGKIQSGLLQRNQYSLGHFTECLNFRHDLKPLDNVIIQGQYCLMSLRATENATLPEENVSAFDWRLFGDVMKNQSLILYHGICLPASCSSQKIVEFTNKFFQQADLVSFAARSCQTSDAKSFQIIDIVAIIIYSIFGIFVIASTLYDLTKRRNKADPNKLFISFSVYTNGKQLFDVTKNKSPDAINCLAGLRSMSLFWIMLGHRFHTHRAFAITNTVIVEQQYYDVYRVIINAYSLAVDTFFTMGALLITISTLKSIEKRCLNIPKMIFHRYIRYTPTFAAIILFNVSLIKWFSEGPIKKEFIIKRCETYWWSALLHIQNYVNPLERCLYHSWYLSADFQLFIISPFLIYPAWKYGWKYLWSWLVLALASSIYVLTMCLVNGVTYLVNGVVYKTSEEIRNLYTRFIYQATHARFGPWMMGMVLGYILYSTRNRNITFGWKLNSSLWILSLSILTLVLFGTQRLEVPFNEISLLENAFYIGFYRLAWSCAVFWIIFACQKLKTGGIIRWFLSLPQWQPIARMSLSMYLVHFVYQATMMENLKAPITYEVWPLMHLFSGDIVASSILGTILYLTFEAPFLLVEKYIYDWRDSKSKILMK